MSEEVSTVASAINALKQLTAEQIDARLDEIESEASALRAIRRGMNARDRKSNGKARKPRARKETADAA